MSPDRASSAPVKSIISQKLVARLDKKHPGFLSAVQAVCTFSKSGHHVLDTAAWDFILDHFHARAEVTGEAEPMNPIEVARHFKDAIAAWIKAGRPVVPDEIFEERIAICLQCDLWNPKAWLGLGGCRICKCGKVAQRLATSQCPLPIPKWISYEAPRLPKGV